MKFIKSVLLFVVALGLGVYYLSTQNNKTIMDLLGSDDWNELPQISTHLAQPMGLPYQAPTLPDKRLMEHPPTVDDNSGLSPRLKRNLLKAEQLRNILDFEGFLKLKCPDQFALKEITDVVYMDSHYFVVDEPGMQVLKFDEQGEFVEPIGRHGEGPGEFQRPRSISRAYGSNLLLMSNYAVQLFSTEGQLIREFKGIKQGVAMGGRTVIWDQQDTMFVADALSESSGKQYVKITLSSDVSIGNQKPFGERFHYYDQHFAPRFGFYATNTFAKIGNRIWIGSPHNTDIGLYNLDGRLAKVLPSSSHPQGITFTDYEKLSTNIPKKEFHDFRLQKITNHSIHEMGPLVIRVLNHPINKFYIYDIYNQEARLLAKGLKPGVSTVQILDTTANQLVGKLIGLEAVAWSKDALNKFLYKPELEALEGFLNGSDQDHHYLWLASLAD